MESKPNIPIRKSWGQNFIIDKNIINKIIKSIDPNSNDTILEIGPGKGALTIPLSSKVKDIIAIEIDPMLCDFLNTKNIKNLNIVNQDILKWENTNYLDEVKIIGNLPYNISSPIIFKFLNTPYWNEMIIMVQKELADRMIANVSTKDYSRMSIMIQTFCKIEDRFNISKHIFHPKPKVESSIIKLKRKEIDINYAKFSEFIKKMFKQRRKKIKNNLTTETELEFFKNFLDLRPENIEVENYLEIFQKING